MKICSKPRTTLVTLLSTQSLYSSKRSSLGSTVCLIFQYSQLPRPAVHERADAGPVLRVGYDEPEHPRRGTHTTKSIVLSAI